MTDYDYSVIVYRPGEWQEQSDGRKTRRLIPTKVLRVDTKQQALAALARYPAGMARIEKIEM